MRYPLRMWLTSNSMPTDVKAVDNRLMGTCHVCPFTLLLSLRKLRLQGKLADGNPWARE